MQYFSISQAMKLGAGGFGHIYVLCDIKSKDLSVLKAEPALPLHKSQLPIELHVMKQCQSNFNCLTEI